MLYHNSMHYCHIYYYYNHICVQGKGSTSQSEQAKAQLERNLAKIVQALEQVILGLVRPLNR